MPLLVKDIRDLLAPFKQLLHKGALSATYKSLLLGTDAVRGVGPNGALKVRMTLGLEDDVVVDASPFLALCDSLPDDKELVLKVDEGALGWSCGRAKGRIALASLEPSRIAEPVTTKFKGRWAPPEDFSLALRLGALSCDAAALSSVGMHGLALYCDEESGTLTCASSDNVTITAVTIPAAGLQAGMEPVYLAPDAGALLAGVLSPKGKLWVREGEVIYTDDEGLWLTLKQVAPLKQNLRDFIEDKFGSREQVASIPSESIGAFVKRVAVLSEQKRKTRVRLRAAKKKLYMEFFDSLAAGEEYFMLEGLVLPGELSIEVDAGHMARAMQHADRVVFDHFGAGVLVFLGGEGDGEPSFVHLVSGKAPTQ